MKILPALTILGCAAMSANAIVFIDESFTYADGNLTNAAAWDAHSGAGSNPLQVISGTVVLQHGSGSREDVSVSIAAQSSGTLTAEFDLMVHDSAAIAGSDSEFFAHFLSGSTFVGRVDVVPASSGGDYSLGLAITSGTAEVTWGTDLSFATTYTVGLSFEFSTGLASLSVNGGPSIGTTATASGETLDGFGLRQSDSSSDETITIDNLMIYDRAIGAIPEPSRFGLLGGLMVLGFAMKRRRG